MCAYQYIGHVTCVCQSENILLGFIPIPPLLFAPQHISPLISFNHLFMGSLLKQPQLSSSSGLYILLHPHHWFLEVLFFQIRSFQLRTPLFIHREHTEKSVFGRKKISLRQAVHLCIFLFLSKFRICSKFPNFGLQLY